VLRTPGGRDEGEGGTVSISAIETEYAGHRFRSRLEARWAVFFDHLGIRWVYEPQGYELGNGERYLPDFWLPELRVWGEVKGALSVDEHVRILAAADRHGLPITYEHGVRPCDIDLGQTLWDVAPSIERLLVLGDIPPPGEVAWLHPILTLDRGAVALHEVAFYAAKGKPVLIPLGWPYSPMSLRTDAPDRFTVPLQGRAVPVLVTQGKVIDAYGAARKSRFEYGESGYLKPALKEAAERLNSK
jgi:hypothetical protein